MSKSRSRTARKLLTRGLKHQQQGWTGLAEECFRHALMANSRCGEALHPPGLMAPQELRFRESVGLTNSAPALNPEDVTPLSNLADSYPVQGETEHTLPHYRRLVERCPQSAEARLKLGEAHESLGEFEAASDCYRRALELQPDSVEANCKLGSVLRRRGELAEALRLCQHAVELDPTRAETYADLALVLADMNELGAASEACQRSLELKPDSGRTALTLSYLRFKYGDIPAAAEALRGAVKLDPTQHLAHLSLGSVLSLMGDLEGALECYKRARALCPRSPDVTLYLGLLRLLQGNFVLGWAEYEEREEARRMRKRFEQPQWKGEPLEGARIFLQAEQGLGDTLQAVRYVPMVAARGGQVVLAVQSKLYRLLAGTEGAWQVITEGGTVSDFRWHCPLFSLPLAFGTELSTIPAKIPYVYADPALVNAWRERLAMLASGVSPPAAGGSASCLPLPRSLRIGLAWGGDPKHPQDFRRSIPLEQFVPLTHVEGTTFYSLQVGPAAEELKKVGARAQLIDVQNELKDFSETAAVVANLDLVISVDTSVVHLAGAMGKPVWVLVSNPPDWRWLLEREDSPWYPTARLFRQATMGNWQEVVARVEGALRGLVGQSFALEPGGSRGGERGAENHIRYESSPQRRSLSAPPVAEPQVATRGAKGHSVANPLSLKPHVRKLLSEGIAHHRAGRQRPAVECYLRSLEADPRCPQALHLLGLSAQQAGQYQESIRLLRESLALNPDDPDTLNSLADSYIGQGEMQAASQCLGRLAELRPQSAQIHHRLGKTLERVGEFESAAASYRRALALQPDSPDIYSNLARLQGKQGAFPEAVESCRRALALDPHKQETHTQLGNALTDLGDFDAALEAHRRALAFKPDSAPAVYGLGYLFERKGDLTSAVDSYQKALKLDPGLRSACLHLGTAYHRQGELAKAAECCDQLLKLEPDSAEARSLLGLIHLVQGNFRDGWGEYEDRWRTAYGFRFRRKFSRPRWKGEPLEGSRILLYAEQGSGDTLQFVRYVPLVAARGGKVILEVPSYLHRLLAPTSGAAKVICQNEALPEFDWQCPLASLPLAFNTDLDTVPAQVPYVHADPAQVQAWRERLAVLGGAGGSPTAPARQVSRPCSPIALRIGLAWAGNALNPHDQWRSIPLEQLAPLTNLEGTTFYSLQLGPPAKQVKQLGHRAHLIDLQNELKDFADTAAVVASLDLVISVDTAVAHLAGAMGKAVWILLHKSNDWRWMLEREDSPWYPTARLFRQSALGNWQELVSRVEGELRAVTGHSPCRDE